MRPGPLKEQSSHAEGELACNYNRSEEEFLQDWKSFCFFLDFYPHTHTIWHVQQGISCGETNTIKPDRGLDEKHGWIMEKHHKQQWLCQKKLIKHQGQSQQKQTTALPLTMSGALPGRMTPPVHSDLEVMEAVERSSSRKL